MEDHSRPLLIRETPGTSKHHASGIITHDFYQNFPNSDKNSDKNLNSDKNFDKQSRCRLESVT